MRSVISSALRTRAQIQTSLGGSRIMFVPIENHIARVRVLIANDDDAKFARLSPNSLVARHRC